MMPQIIFGWSKSSHPLEMQSFSSNHDSKTNAVKFRLQSTTALRDHFQPTQFPNSFPNRISVHPPRSNADSGSDFHRLRICNTSSEAFLNWEYWRTKGHPIFVADAKSAFRKFCRTHLHYPCLYPCKTKAVSIVFNPQCFRIIRVVFRCWVRKQICWFWIKFDTNIGWLPPCPSQVAMTNTRSAYRE